MKNIKAVFTKQLLGTSVFTALCGYSEEALARFVLSLICGIILSGLAGAAIGIFGKNQMAASSLTLPVMMLFSFSPMLSMFNESIKKIAEITYLQQISDIINGIGISKISARNILVISANFVIGIGLFAAAYRKRGLE